MIYVVFALLMPVVALIIFAIVFVYRCDKIIEERQVILKELYYFNTPEQTRDRLVRFQDTTDRFNDVKFFIWF